MALFGKKKKEEEVPELEFGFPASRKRERVEGVTPITPVEPEDLETPGMPELEPIEPPGSLPPIPKMAPPKPMKPEPEMGAPKEPRPERIRTPPIRALRPHVFLKISKYREVLNSIDEVMDHIKDLRKSLKNIHEVEEKEAVRIKESEDILAKLEEVAKTFDRIFSSPEK
jgi:hypothetical protein